MLCLWSLFLSYDPYCSNQREYEVSRIFLSKFCHTLISFWHEFCRCFHLKQLRMCGGISKMIFSWKFAILVAIDSYDIWKKKLTGKYKILSIILYSGIYLCFLKVLKRCTAISGGYDSLQQSNYTCLIKIRQEEWRVAKGCCSRMKLFSQC